MGTESLIDFIFWDRVTPKSKSDSIPKNKIYQWFCLWKYFKKNTNPQKYNIEIGKTKSMKKTKNLTKPPQKIYLVLDFFILGYFLDFSRNFSKRSGERAAAPFLEISLKILKISQNWNPKREFKKFIKKIKKYKYIIKRNLKPTLTNN